MIPVDMREFSDKAKGQVGDCYRCCLASILELPYEKVPHFYKLNVKSYQWEELVDAWLSGFGLHRLAINTVKNENHTRFPPTFPGFYILSGPSPRTDETGKNFIHAVVGLNGICVHDPHPSRAGILEIQEAEYFVSLHPERGLMK